MTDDEFLTSFTNCTLDRSHFNHLGHVRLAWIHLQRQPFDEAVTRTCEGIRNYATSLGAAGKFHWTITEALAGMSGFLTVGQLAGHCGVSRTTLLFRRGRG